MGARIWFCISCLWLAACGPPELPGFANPPDPDAGKDAGSHDDDDAGASHSGKPAAKKSD